MPLTPCLDLTDIQQGVRESTKSKIVEFFPLAPTQILVSVETKAISKG